MTATVTTTYARAPIADVLSVESVKGLSDADLKKTYGMIWAPGQLWERVAESHAPVDTNTDGIPDNCAVCGNAVHTDAYTGKLVHGFDPAL